MHWIAGAFVPSCALEHGHSFRPSMDGIRKDLTIPLIRNRKELEKYKLMI